MTALEEDLRARKLGYRYYSDTDPVTQARIWSLREAALGLSMAMKEDAKSISFVEDTAVAPEKLSEYIGRFLAIVREHGTTAGVYAHASVGCLHVRPVVNMKTEEGVAKFESYGQGRGESGARIRRRAFGRAWRRPGARPFHAPDVRRYIVRSVPRDQAHLRSAWDFQSRQDCRFAADDVELAVRRRRTRRQTSATFFDYSEYGGFGGAVEMCSGVGACRKKLAGTMCPSYMATRDENALHAGPRQRAAPRHGRADSAKPGWAIEGVYDVLDLCLECRACKAECPVGVDMARFKSEFLADYWTPPRNAAARSRARRHRRARRYWVQPLRSRVKLGRSGAVNAGMIGIDGRRKLPAWKRQTFARWRGGAVLARVEPQPRT